jgi:DNA polymerase III alpha subunit
MREITTKKGQKMAFVKLNDEVDEIEIILFPSIYQQTIGIWERDRVVIVKGKISAQDRDGNITNEIKVMVDDAREVTHEQAAAYQPTGKKRKTPKPSNKSLKAVPLSKKDDSKPETKRLYIRIEDSGNSELLISLKQTIDQYKGEYEVVLVLGPNDSKQAVKLPVKFSLDPGALEKLSNLIGAENVKLA